MSVDLYFWKSALLADPDVVIDRLAMDDSTVVLPDPAVADFRAELLARWPELQDRVSPGDAELQTFFVIMEVPHRWESDQTDAVVALVVRHGLCLYDPQTRVFLSPDGYRPTVDHRTGQAATFSWAEPDGPLDEDASHRGPLPTWPIWDAKTSPRLRPSRLAVDGISGDEVVTLYRGEDIITRRGVAVVTGKPGHPDAQRLTAALREELATAEAQLFGNPLAETKRYYTEQLQGEGDHRAYLLIADSASILFRHHTFTGLDILVSTDPEYPLVIAYSRLDEYPDLVAMDTTQWTHP